MMPTTTSNAMKPDDERERDRQVAAIRVGADAVRMAFATVMVVAVIVADDRARGGRG